MKNFDSIGLPDELLRSLEKCNFTNPTPVQEQVIPGVLKGEDILATAQTGTGKTGAFAIPLTARLFENPQETVLVLTPTRELATQVLEQFHKFLKGGPTLRSALLIGGDPIGKQFTQLKMKPRLIVGTPGRINDHLKRGTLNLRNTQSLVLDEIDRMLDMGFGVQLATIIEKLPKTRQTLMFSATLPSYIENLAAKYLKKPLRITVETKKESTLKIDQKTHKLKESDKYVTLIKELEERSGSVVIFVKTKRSADQLAGKLTKLSHDSKALHGDLRQNVRTRVMDAFRKEKYRILVATDIAARGLDVPHIRHVINYDLPQCREDYIHRIGRTGRAGSTGSALSFVTPQDNQTWKGINRLLPPEIRDKDISSAPSGPKRSFKKSAPHKSGKPLQKRTPRTKTSSTKGRQRLTLAAA